VTGGGRGVGAHMAASLARDGWEVVVAARSGDEIAAVAERIGGRAIQMDIASLESVERGVAEAGWVELLVANAGIASWFQPSWEQDPDDWWQMFEVNVRGVHNCCRTVIPGMLERGGGRIVITGSGTAYDPTSRGSARSAYSASKAAVCRYGEVLASELGDRLPTFVISPGLVRSSLTESVAESVFTPDSPWTEPERAAELVAKLASGRYDALAGRFLHAAHDDVDDLLQRIEEVVEHDLNTARMRR
jgi:NAD(P)-dependent dehydrogenase (short-subunit alcohol dehydrogenase family)